MKKLTLFACPVRLGSHSARSAAIGLASLLLGGGIALAEIPEPDAVVYGKVRHRFSEALATSTSSEVTVVAKVNGSVLAEYNLASGSDTFVLRIPMDDGREPRLPSTARSGDRVRFFVRNNVSQKEYECVQSYASPWILPPERAPLAAMDLFVEANVAGLVADADGDDLPDYWENQYGLNSLSQNANADSDGDGMCDLSEYLAGTNPVQAESKLLINLQRNPTAPAGLLLSISPAISDRTYAVQVSSAIGGEWTEQTVVRPSHTGELTVALPAPEATTSLFFRVAVISDER